MVAAVMLSGAAVVISAVTARSLHAAKLDTDYELAWQLLDRQLTLIDHIGIENFIRQGQMQGEFEQFQPPYQWFVSASPQDYPGLYLVRATVSWQTNNRTHSICTETMLNTETATVPIELQE
jgi:hypothetical protein